jgi:hypothetical protein
MLGDDHDHIYNSTLRGDVNEWAVRGGCHASGRYTNSLKQLPIIKKFQIILFLWQSPKHFTYRIVLFVTCTRHEYSWNTSPLTLNNNKSTKLLCQLFLIKINNFTYWELKIVAPVAPFLRHFDIFWLCMKYLQLDVNQPTIDCDVIMNTSFQYLNWQISTYLTLISGVSR